MSWFILNENNDLNYGFREFINECLHPEAFSGKIPVRPKTNINVDNEEEQNANQLQIGIGLIYDSVHDTVDIFNEHKYDFYEKRYVMLGSVFNISKNEVKCLSPYFIKVSFNPKKFNTQEEFSKQIKETIKQYTEPIIQKIGGNDIKAETLKEYDIKNINEHLPEIAETLRNLSSYIQFHEDIDNLLINETSIINNDSFLMNSFGPEYFSSLDISYNSELEAQSEYKQLSNEEFYNSNIGIINANEDDIKEEMHPIEHKKEERKPANEIYSFDTLFKKRFNRADWFECFIPVILKIKIS